MCPSNSKNTLMCNQYAFAKMATSVAGWPVIKQVSGPAFGWSNG